MHAAGHPENILLVEGGVASLSPTELQRYSVDRDDITGAGEVDGRCAARHDLESFTIF